MVEPTGKAELRATRRAAANKGAVITENLDSHFRNIRTAQQQVASQFGDVFAGSSGMVRRASARYPVQGAGSGRNVRAQSGFNVDRVFDVPHNPFRNRTAVETPKNDKERRARFRYYYQYEPMVGSAIDLHTEFPISTFGLVHEDKHLEKEFNEIADDIKIYEFMRDMAREYWMVGEAFPFGFFDDSHDPSVWTKFILLNPDLVKVINHEMMRGDHTAEISLQLDSVVMNIVQRGPFDPETKNAFHRLPEDVIEYARHNRPMPLSPLQVSHFRRKGSNTFGLRGESLLSRIMHVLSYRDKLRDGQYCLKPGTDVMTARGFIPIEEVCLKDKVATYDKDTKEISFEHPKECLQFDYDGDMYTFKNRKIDFTCTANHRCLVTYLSNHTKAGQVRHTKVVQAKDVKYYHSFITNGDWTGWDEAPKTVEFGGKDVPLETFLEFAGYYVSEGSVPKMVAAGGSSRGYLVEISQTPSSASREVMELCLRKLPFNFRFYDYSAGMPVNDKALRASVSKMFGVGSRNKKVPRWIKRLPPKYQEIFLDAAILGDGTVCELKSGTKRVRYPTISRRLADDIQEMAWKCGYNPTMGGFKCKSGSYCHTINWSKDKTKGRICRVDDLRNAKREGGGNISVENYKGKVYCLSVPNHFFVTRQNGKVVIHGNSIADRHVTPREFYFIGSDNDPADESELQAFADMLANSWLDPNLAVVWHHAVKVDWRGAADKILPIRQELDQLDMEMLAGLMMNKAFIYGEGPCGDDQTETLTENGWKLMKDVQDGERIAGFDYETGELKYEHFANRIVRDYDGDMHYYTSRRYDLAMTPNHWHVYRKDQEDWQVGPVDQMPKSHMQFRNTIGAWAGDPDSCKGMVQEASEILDVALDEGWFLKFLGFYISEGCVPVGSEQQPFAQVRLRQSVLSEEFGEFDELLDAAPFKISKYERNDGTVEWVICHTRFARWLKDLCGKRGTEKFVPKALRSADISRIELFLEYLIMGDGHVRWQGREKQYRYVTYTSASKRLAEDVFELSLKLGHAPVWVEPSPETDNVCYRVQWSLDTDHGKYPWVSAKRNLEIRPYKGKVYCFEMPSGCLLFRRNGKVTTTKNTYANSSVALDVLISRYIDFRLLLEEWMKSNVFGPLCRIHGIYKPTDAELRHRIRVKGSPKKPWVPDISWTKQELRDNQWKTQLYERMVASGLLSREALYRHLNMDPDQIEAELKEEREKMAEDMGPPPELPDKGGLPPPPLPPAGAFPGAGAPGATPELPAPGAVPITFPGGPPGLQRPPESSRPTGIPMG